MKIMYKLFSISYLSHYTAFEITMYIIVIVIIITSIKYGFMYSRYDAKSI